MSRFDRSAVIPCPIRNRLAGVKRHIFNPDLPSIRKMSQDDMMHKLPEEHSRHTTRCTAQQFADAHTRPFRLPDRELRCLSTVTGRGITSHYNKLEDLQESYAAWSRFLADKRHLSGRYTGLDLDTLCSNKNIDDWHFDGVMLRVIKPEIRDWRLTFKCEPGLDQSGRARRVTPSDINTRHRHLTPHYNYCDGTICNRK